MNIQQQQNSTFLNDKNQYNPKPLEQYGYDI